MVFSYNWLKDYVKNLPKPEELAELLTLRSFEVSEVKKTKGDYVLDIDVLPNRAGDCFSHLGIAREIAAVLNSKSEIRNSKQIQNSKFQTKNFVSVEVRNQLACPRYTAILMTDIKVGPSPKWLKERLEVCGLNSINNIVDIANYVMLETGQPLHVFDGERLEGRKIIVRFAKKGESITTLDNQKFDLNPGILVIADAKKPVAIAGIKGGKLPEIDKETKTVVLESANFNPGVIRKGSKGLGLKTDSSLRFEHGLDPNLTEFAINRAAYLIQEEVQGKIDRGLVDVYPKKVYPKKIRLDLNYVKSLLGVEISKKGIIKILRNLEFKVREIKKDNLEVLVPTRRLDLALPEDLIEEIGRIYGYEKIPATFPTVALIPPKRNDQIFWENMVKDILKEAGFTEVYNYSFVKDNGAIEVANPISQEYRYLRPSLIPNLLKNIEKNIKNFNQIKIFELGKVFQDKTEKRMLTGMVSGEDFYQLKGAVDLLLNKLGISNIWYDDFEATPEDSPKTSWHPKKSAEIKIDHQEIGFLGELREEPKAARGEPRPEGRVVAFDLDFEMLQKLTSEGHEYRPISRYPATIRDLAILVPPFTKVEEVLNVMEIAGGSLVRDIDLFDIYEGEGLPEGQKSLAFHIIYQAEDRTLKSIEVYKIHQKIIKALEENPTWQVRK